MLLQSSRVVGRPVPRTAAQASVVRRPSHAAARRLVVRRTAEEAAPAAEAEAAEAPAEPLLSPLDKAKKALDSESLDKAVLTSCLAELEAEMASMQAAVASSEARIKMLEGSVGSAKDQLLRLNADFDNFRRRTGEEKAVLKDTTRGDLVKDLLPLVDNFELARTQVKAETEAEQKINNSYQGLYKQMVEILRLLGVEAVPTVGAPFDPNIHEAIMREPSTEHPDGTVLMEFRKGFRIGDKLVRPAMVKVSYTEDFAGSSEE